MSCKNELVLKKINISFFKDQMNVNNKNREDRVNPVQDAMTMKNLH